MTVACFHQTFFFGNLQLKILLENVSSFTIFFLFQKLIIQQISNVCKNVLIGEVGRKRRQAVTGGVWGREAIFCQKMFNFQKQIYSEFPEFEVDL